MAESECGWAGTAQAIHRPHHILLTSAKALARVPAAAAVIPGHRNAAAAVAAAIAVVADAAGTLGPAA